MGSSSVVVCALLATTALSEEPGQTPRPKGVEPPQDIPEAELVKLDKKLPWFEKVESPGPFIYRGNRLLDARREGAAYQELKAYNYVLAFAKNQSVERLNKYSAKNVTVANLYHEKLHKEYLNDLIHMEGKLVVIRSMKPTEELEEIDGVKELYECWLYASESSKFVDVVVSELPPELKPGEHQTAWVSFDAYYFKLFHYESEQVKEGSKDPNKHQWQSAPLFLGKTVEVIQSRDVQQSAFTSSMLGGILGGLGALIGIAFLITLWFRRGDKQLQATARRRIEQEASFEDIPDSPSPVNRISDMI
jgi:hypothetical protein